MNDKIPGNKTMFEVYIAAKALKHKMLKEMIR